MRFLSKKIKKRVFRSSKALFRFISSLDDLLYRLHTFLPQLLPQIADNVPIKD